MAIASDMYQYLDHGGVEAIIKPLLRRLLVKMPEEPVAFIIKDLCSQYPNEAGKTVAALTKVSEQLLVQSRILLININENLLRIAMKQEKLSLLSTRFQNISRIVKLLLSLVISTKLF